MNHRSPSRSRSSSPFTVPPTPSVPTLPVKLSFSHTAAIYLMGHQAYNLVPNLESCVQSVISALQNISAYWWYLLLLIIPHRLFLLVQLSLFLQMLILHRLMIIIGGDIDTPLLRLDINIGPNVISFNDVSNLANSLRWINYLPTVDWRFEASLKISVLSSTKKP